MNAGSLRGLAFKVFPGSPVVFVLADGTELRPVGWDVQTPHAADPATGAARPCGPPVLIITLERADERRCTCAAADAVKETT